MVGSGVLFFDLLLGLVGLGGRGGGHGVWDYPVRHGGVVSTGEAVYHV